MITEQELAQQMRREVKALCPNCAERLDVADLRWARSYRREGHTASWDYMWCTSCYVQDSRYSG